jgi:hypothetical protein
MLRRRSAPIFNDNIVYPNSNGSPTGEGSSGGPGSGGFLDFAGLGFLVPGNSLGIWFNLYFEGGSINLYATSEGGPGNAETSMLPLYAVVLPSLTLTVGLVLGYSIRACISQHRKRLARRVILM